MINPSELIKLGAEATRNFGGRRVVDLLKYQLGPTLMIRINLDGLRVQEQTDLVYAS